MLDKHRLDMLKKIADFRTFIVLHFYSLEQLNWNHPRIRPKVKMKSLHNILMDRSTALMRLGSGLQTAQLFSVLEPKCRISAAQPTQKHTLLVISRTQRESMGQHTCYHCQKNKVQTHALWLMGQSYQLHIESKEEPFILDTETNNMGFICGVYQMQSSQSRKRCPPLCFLSKDYIPRLCPSSPLRGRVL